MPAPERLTIDMTVVLDRIGDRRGGRARELFALHRAGEIELAFATSGRIFDVGTDPRGEVDKLLRDEDVAETPQLSYAGVMFPGPNAFPGATVDGFGAAWAAITETWNGPGKRPDERDALHVETHVLLEREVFVTNDTGILTMCRRLRDESVFDVAAMTLDHYLDARPLTPR